MPNESKPIVLVADDEPSMVAMLASHLRSKGYSVLEASDGDQAWELAHEHLPNLVLLDVMMPGMSGWEVCRKIREAVSLAHTGVIMLTGIGENLNEMTSPLYGADAYLDKPFEFSDLDRKISETIARRADGALGRADGDGDEGSGVKKALRAATSAKKPAKAQSKTAPKPPLAKAVARLEPDADEVPEKAKTEKTGKPAPMPMPAALRDMAKPAAKVAPKAAAPVAKSPSKPSEKASKAELKPTAKDHATLGPKPAKPAPKPAKPAPKAKPTPKAAKPAPKAKPTPKAKPAPKAATPPPKAEPTPKAEPAPKAATPPPKPAKKR